jgi:hypothetical protein
VATIQELDITKRDGWGGNKYGKILMEIRDALRKELLADEDEIDFGDI